jgi:MFS family permease
MIEHLWILSRDTRRRSTPALLVLFRATADVLLLTVLVVYVGRRGTPFEVGMVTVSYFFALTVFSPVWGALADVTGRRYSVLLSTCVVSTFAILPLAGVSGVWLLIVGIGVYAVFASAYSPLVLAIVSDRSTITDRGGSIGIINSARAGGGAAGRFGAGLIVGLFRPVLVFLVISGASLVGVIFALFVDDPSSRDGFEIRAVLDETRSRLIPAVSGDVLQTAGLRWLYLSVAVQGMAVTGILSLMPVYLTQDVGTSELVMGALLGISPGLQIGFMYVMGKLTDHVGRKPMIVVGTFGRGVVFSVFAAAATSFALLEIRVLVVAIAFVVLSVSFAAMFSGAVAFIGDVTPTDRSSEFMGLLWTALGVGGVFGPVLLGSIATYTGYEVSFLAGTALAIGATGIALFGLDPVFSELTER